MRRPWSTGGWFRMKQTTSDNLTVYFQNIIKILIYIDRYIYIYIYLSKIIPARDPTQCGGSKKIMYYIMLMMMLILVMMLMVMRC